MSAGVLTVSGDDEDDQISIRCGNDGNVKVNRRRPDTGPVACTEITSITVSGGGGFDAIHLQRVGTTTYTALTSVMIDGCPEAESIVASQIVDTLLGGEGNDGFKIESFDDATDAGMGRDRASIVWLGRLRFPTRYRRV